MQLALEKPLRICWWCFSPWCVDLAELAEIHDLVLPYNFSELPLQTVSADKAVVAVVSQPRFSCKKDLFQSNKADQASEEAHICWCVAGKSLAGMHWAAVSVHNLSLVSFLQPDIVLLRDRLCRAQGELPAGQEAIKAPYERQPMPKDQAGPVAGQVPGPQASAQQYYQQVN